MNLRERFRQEGIPHNPLAPQDRDVFFGDRIRLTDGDITCLHVDCIVRAAAMPLVIVDGVKQVYHNHPMLPPEYRMREDCKIGEAKLSADYIQNARFSVLTRGPSYLMENDCELLKSCYRNCLDLAFENGLHSIAFPIISLGKFRFPKELAVRCAVEGVLSWLSLHPEDNMQIVFVCAVPELFDGTLAALKDALNEDA